MRRGSIDLPVEIETELGAAAPIRLRSEQCAFSLPAQAELVTVRTTWLVEDEQVSYRLESVSCDGKERSTLESGDLTVHLRSIEIKNLRIPHNSFLLVSLKRAGGDETSIVLNSDQFAECSLFKEKP